MKFSFLLLPAALLIAAAIPGARAGSPLPGDIDQNDDEAAYEAAHAKTYALLDYVRNHSKEDALADGFGIAYLPFENLDAAKKFLAENATPLEAGNGAQYEVVADGDCATIALHGVDSYSQKFCAGDKFRFKGKEYSVAGVPPAQGLVTNGIVFRTDKYVSHPVILLRDQEGRGLVTTTDWLRPVKSLLDTSFTSTKGHAGSQCNGIMLFHPAYHGFYLILKEWLRSGTNVDVYGEGNIDFVIREETAQKWRSKGLVPERVKNAVDIDRN